MKASERKTFQFYIPRHCESWELKLRLRRRCKMIHFSWHFNVVPSELFTEICYWLNYIEIASESMTLSRIKSKRLSRKLRTLHVKILCLIRICVSAKRKNRVTSSFKASFKKLCNIVLNKISKIPQRQIKKKQEEYFS